MSETVQSLADARADREARFLIARRNAEFALFERGDDGLLTEVHSNCISLAAAERLRADLIAGRCPFSLATRASDRSHGDYVARCYDTASRIVPLLDGVADAWSVALRIAHAAPWVMPCDHPDIPF